MARPTLLEPDRVRERLAELDGWSFDGSALVRELRFGDFERAFGFMTALAAEAERLHPSPETDTILQFIRETKRGVCRFGRRTPPPQRIPMRHALDSDL